MKNKLFTFGLVLAFIVGISGVAFANPLFFGATVQTNSATSTPATLIPGVATSTLVFDSLYGNTKSNAVATKSAVLLMQFVGSTTSSVVNVSFEYSQDCSDWYSNTLYSQVSTSSNSQTLNTLSSYSWTYASSSQTLGGVAQGRIARRIVTLPTPTRCTRVVFTATGATSTIWSQIVPNKEIQ